MRTKLERVGQVAGGLDPVARCQDKKPPGIHRHLATVRDARPDAVGGEKRFQERRIEHAAQVVELDKGSPGDQGLAETLVQAAHAAVALRHHAGRFVVECRRYLLPIAFARLRLVGLCHICRNPPLDEIA